MSKTQVIIVRASTRWAKFLCLIIIFSFPFVLMSITMQNAGTHRMSYFFFVLDEMRKKKSMAYSLNEQSLELKHTQNAQVIKNSSLIRGNRKHCKTQNKTHSFRQIIFVCGGGWWQIIWERKRKESAKFSQTSTF